MRSSIILIGWDCLALRLTSLLLVVLIVVRGSSLGSSTSRACFLESHKPLILKILDILAHQFYLCLPRLVGGVVYVFVASVQHGRLILVIGLRRIVVSIHLKRLVSGCSHWVVVVSLRKFRLLYFDAILLDH